jgi:hypothetical protein
MKKKKMKSLGQNVYFVEEQKGWLCFTLTTIYVFAFTPSQTHGFPTRGEINFGK